MPSFWSYIGNGEHSVGCTGQSVYLYDKNGTELARFRGLRYVYQAAISPRGDHFVTKSAEGILAVYSIDPPAMIKKFRCSKTDCGADEGFCFSADGSVLYNIEHNIGQFRTEISVYDTADYSLKRRILDSDGSLMLTGIENGKDGDEIFLLGYYRNDEGIADRYFVGKLIGDELRETVFVPYKDYNYFFWYLELRRFGFTKKKYEWSYMEEDLDSLKAADLHLSDLWERYGKEQES